MVVPARDAPRVVSNYRLDRVLGRGGMGVVYEATDTRNGTSVALKLLHEHLEADEAFRERFKREAHVATLLRSPYTVHLLDYGIEHGEYFLVMKLVEGRSLRDFIRAGPLRPAEALRIGSQVARALEEAEARGVVHRDIKPDNVMIADDGAVQVLDFGIARQAGAATITSTGAFVGTLAYASPESIEGRVDHRSDIYSLGVTIYHMLAGRPPFVGEMAQLLRMHREAPMPLDPLLGLPAAVIEAVARCMEKDPEERFQSASELAGVLEHLAEESTRRDDPALMRTTTEALSPAAGASATSTVALSLGAPVSRRQLLPRARLTRYDLTLRNYAHRRSRFSWRPTIATAAAKSRSRNWW